MSCRTGCHRTVIESRLTTANGSAYTCGAGFLFEGVYYTTYRITFPFTNGSYYEETIYPDTIIVNNDGECEDFTTDTDFDPEFSYGSPVGDPVEAYSGPIDLEDIAAAALGGVVWGSPASELPLVVLAPTDWHDDTPRAIASLTNAVAGGLEATATLHRAEFRVTGYRHLPVELSWTDSEGVSGSLTLPSDGSWSSPISPSSPATDTTTSIEEITVKIGKYI